MDFLFYKFLNHNNVAQAKLNIDLCEDQQVHCGLNYVSAYRPSTNRILNDSTGLLLSGHIQYKTYNRSHSLEILDEHLNNGEWPLSDLFSGFFSGVQFSDDIIRIFNDPIGLFHLYYCITSNFIVVATNLNAIYSITGSTMRRSALLLEMTGPEFSQYGRSTVLENVFTLMPGEMLVFRNGKTERFFDTTIKIEDKPGRKNLAYELVDLINSEFKSFYQEDNELMVSMSGGIDSRVNLAALLANGKKPLLSNFGKPEYIDSKIPLKIACQIKLPIDIIDSVSYQFPPQAVIDKIVKETDSLYINQWLSLFDYYREKLPPYSFFILGDMCDILRAKGISTLKTRNFRLNHYIKKFFTGSQLTLLPISEERKKRFKLDKRDKILRQVIEAANVYFGEKRNDSLVDEVESDINELFNHLDLYAASFIESYEELFGIFTHGRRSMGKQLNILKVAFTPEIPILNLRIIRNVLNFNPVVRYGDELTNQMSMSFS